MINDDAASPRIITLSSQISALAHSVPVPTASFCAIDFYFFLFFFYREGSKCMDNARHRESLDFPLYELSALERVNTLVKNSPFNIRKRESKCAFRFSRGGFFFYERTRPR